MTNIKEVLSDNRRRAYLVTPDIDPSQQVL